METLENLETCLKDEEDLEHLDDENDMTLEDLDDQENPVEHGSLRTCWTWRT